MPSILTERERHARYCRVTLGDVPANRWGSPGDVRRCEHGKVQLAYEVPGTIPPYWRDLSPVLNPVLYRRAVRALRESP